MLLDIIRKGSTDRSVLLRIIDSTDGTPETGVVFNTAGIDLWYRREGAAVVSVTEATLAALTTAHTDGGFLTVSHGYYRLDLPDAAFATGANYVDVGGTVTGMVVVGGRVRLIDADFEAAIFTDAEIALAVWAAATRTLTSAANITSTGGTTVPQTGDSYARIGAPAGASVSADIAAIANVLPSGAVVADGGNSATTFVTNRTETATDYWKDALLLVTSGVMVGQVKKVSAYNGTTKAVTLTAALTGTPATGVTFLLVNR